MEAPVEYSKQLYDKYIYIYRLDQKAKYQASHIIKSPIWENPLELSSYSIPDIVNSKSFE